MKIVKFSKTAGSYFTGDVASFDDVQADAYVKLGFATYVEEPVVEPVQANDTPEIQTTVPKNIAKKG